jgi:catechol 2,3-dioxygenase-like lactoylglutathione lyase family enzyme
MITGVHGMIFTKDEAADRAFLRDVLEIPCIDSGGGWLIFKLPPAELGVHSGDNGFHQIYFICDDADAFVRRMAEKGVAADPITDQAWGRSTAVPLPGGGKLGVYEARHARP